MKTISQLFGNGRVGLEDGSVALLDPAKGFECVPEGIVFGQSYFLPAEAFPVGALGTWEEFMSAFRSYEQECLMGCDRRSVEEAIASAASRRRSHSYA